MKYDSLSTTISHVKQGSVRDEHILVISTHQVIHLTMSLCCTVINVLSHSTHCPLSPHVFTSTNTYLRIASLKRELVHTPSAVESAWVRLLVAIERGLSEIRTSKRAAVPTVNMHDILRNGGQLPHDVALDVRRSGVVVIRNVIPRADAVRWKTQLEEYLKVNRDSVVG